MRILLAVSLIIAVPSAATAADDKSADSRPAQQFGHIIPQIPATSGTPTISSSGHILPSPMSHQRVAITPSAVRLHRPRQGLGVDRQAKRPPVASEEMRDLTLRFEDLPTRERGLW
jgi:hypothetical protein